MKNCPISKRLQPKSRPHLVKTQTCQGCKATWPPPLRTKSGYWHIKCYKESHK